jgi:hypothetical protein
MDELKAGAVNAELIMRHATPEINRKLFLQLYQQFCKH